MLEKQAPPHALGDVAEEVVKEVAEVLLAMVVYGGVPHPTAAYNILQEV